MVVAGNVCVCVCGCVCVVRSGALMTSRGGGGVVVCVWLGQVI